MLIFVAMPMSPFLGLSLSIGHSGIRVILAYLLVGLGRALCTFTGLRVCVVRACVLRASVVRGCVVRVCVARWPGPPNTRKESQWHPNCRAA